MIYIATPYLKTIQSMALVDHELDDTPLFQTALKGGILSKIGSKSRTILCVNIPCDSFSIMAITTSIPRVSK